MLHNLLTRIIQFGLKNFDMVFVYKDYARPVSHINSIPMETLENVKEWLDSSNIPFTEGPLNLNWPTIMKTVVADPHQFFKDGELYPPHMTEPVI